MPKKVLPDIHDFLWFKRQLQKMNFRPITRIEFRKDFERLKLQAPRPRPGREAGFMFFANGLTVRLWTTWLVYEQKAREVDAGWVLICEGDRALYFARPLSRTKNFLVNLVRRAWLAKWRVLHRPLCPSCEHFMDIVTGRSLKSRYWRCNRVKLHSDGKPTFRDWDWGLPPKAKKYVRAERKRRAKYRARREAEGRQPYAAMLNRKPWGGRAA